MTDETKALVERLRGDWPEILVEKHWMMDSDAIDKQREEAADLIETQAREIERLRGALADPHKVHANMLAGYIAKPTPKQILHIYGADAFRAALAGDSHDQ